MARYRKYFLALGAFLFIGGALMRWHQRRQESAIRRMQGSTEVSGEESSSWQYECTTYACRVLSKRSPGCEEMCSEAEAAGRPKVQAERIANACKKFCAAEGGDDPNCTTSCFVRESKGAAK